MGKAIERINRHHSRVIRNQIGSCFVSQHIVVVVDMKQHFPFIQIHSFKWQTISSGPMPVSKFVHTRMHISPFHLSLTPTHTHTEWVAYRYDGVNNVVSRWHCQSCTTMFPHKPPEKPKLKSNGKRPVCACVSVCGILLLFQSLFRLFPEQNLHILRLNIYRMHVWAVTVSVCAPLRIQNIVNNVRSDYFEWKPFVSIL